jgi:hypothetical protein
VLEDPGSLIEFEGRGEHPEELEQEEIAAELAVLSPEFASALDNLFDADAPSQFPPAIIPQTPPTSSTSSLPSTALDRPGLRKPKANKYVDALQNSFIESLGSSADLQQALVRSESPKARKFLVLLTDPRKRKYSLSRLARIAGIDPLDIANIFRSYYHSESLLTMLREMPVIAQDAVQDSRSTSIECPRCDGWGEIQREKIAGKDEEGQRIVEVESRQCPRCKGTGIQHQSGDKDARRFVGEAIGLLKNKNGVAVQVNVNHSGVESVIDELEGILEGNADGNIGNGGNRGTSMQAGGITIDTEAVETE